MKNYIGFARDHSGSMVGLAKFAMKDYNDNIAAVRDSAIRENQDTLVSVVQFSNNPCREITNASVTALKPLTGYACGGGTALFDSVGDLINTFEQVPQEGDTSFLIMAVTDGQDNTSIRYSAKTLADKMRKLQATDRWTFTFRVPRGYKTALVNMGIPEWNVLEWDQTESGIATASIATQTAVKSFYQARAAGARSTDRFYADLASIKPSEVKASMDDISKEVLGWMVDPSEHGMLIQPFVESRKQFYLIGAAFYQLTKTETVQSHKRLMIRDRSTGAIYEGAAARQLLGLPAYGNVKLTPGNHGKFDLFVQSTSVNRKLVGGTQVIYWTAAVR